MGKPVRLSLSLGIALLVFAVSPALAQDFRATLTGRVSDPSNAAIPGVSVQIKNAGTNEATTVISDAQGNYRIPLLKPGTYFVTADIKPLGFQDGVEFCRNLPDRAGVVAIPTAIFYDHPEAARGHVRFAFCKSPETMAEAERRLRALSIGAK